MKKVVTWFLFLLLSVFQVAYAADWYVALTANGDGSGDSYVNRMSRTNYNAGNLDASTNPGDTVWLVGAFDYGLTITEGGSAGTYLTFRMDDPSHPGTIDSSGSNCIVTNGKHYLIFDHLNLDGSSSASFTATSGSDHIRLYSSNITNSDTYAVYINGENGDYSDDIIIGGSGHGNVFVDNGVGGSAGGGFTADHCSNLYIGYNQIYSTSDSWGLDGITFEATHDVEITMNRIEEMNKTANGEDCIDVKGDSYNIDIYQNRLAYIDRQTNVTIQMGCHDVQVHQNWMMDSYWGGVLIKRGINIGTQDMENIEVWGNIIIDGAAGVTITPNCSAGVNCDLLIPGVRIFNNLLLRNGDVGHDFSGIPSYGGALSIRSGTATVIRNNICVNNTRLTDSNAVPYLQVEIDSPATLSDIDYNLYYYSGQSVVFDDEGTARTFATWQSGSGYDTNGVGNTDPVLTNFNESFSTGNYYPTAGSPAIVKTGGYDMGDGSVYSLWAAMPSMADDDPENWTNLDVGNPDSTNWPLGPFLYTTSGGSGATVGGVSEATVGGTASATVGGTQ